MAGTAQNNPATNPAANAAARAALFQTGFPSSIELPAQTFADGGSYTFQLPHAGIGLYAQLRFTGTVTWTTGSAPTISNLAPYNWFKTIQYVDYLGNTRIQSSGWPLHMINKLKYYQQTNGELVGSTSSTYGVTSRDYAYQAAKIDLFALSGTSGTAANVDFEVVVPFTFHENTTLGGQPFTVPAGNNVINLTLNPLWNNTATANAESPLYGTTPTTVAASGSIYCTYYYIDPQPGAALPLMDFAQVYEIVDVKSTDNLTGGATKQVILPTGRTYQGLYGQLVNAGQATDTGISQTQFLINESTPTLNEYYNSYLHRIRRTYGRDLPAGYLYWDFRNRPYSPSSYGSLALQMILSSSFTPSGETFFNLTKESLYVNTNNVY